MPEFPPVTDKDFKTRLTLPDQLPKNRAMRADHRFIQVIGLAITTLTLFCAETARATIDLPKAVEEQLERQFPGERRFTESLATHLKTHYLSDRNHRPLMIMVARAENAMSSTEILAGISKTTKFPADLITLRLPEEYLRPVGLTPLEAEKVAAAFRSEIIDFLKQNRGAVHLGLDLTPDVPATVYRALYKMFQSSMVRQYPRNAQLKSVTFILFATPRMRTRPLDDAIDSVQERETLSRAIVASTQVSGNTDSGYFFNKALGHPRPNFTGVPEVLLKRMSDIIPYYGCNERLSD